MTSNEKAIAQNCINKFINDKTRKTSFDIER
ncbi:hypothetical protein SAMN05444369_110101 [Capnocytophaga haemolytica]|uniref:Uncharacterized protein n=1 Tax=Capnocytophaga haemolytica TaxID=45243 RepID=A0AAX2GXL2_9FLAO|nr:hypothetical protein SAMN05444369_110101 [Capnocytophaga haemolytica]SNV02358.1 Uncharacterised protein [Capnocytophaga haemolytica]